MASLMLERALPRDLANRSQIIETKGKIEDFGRLVEVIETDLARLGDDGNLRKWRQNPVDIRLRFGWADSWPGIPALQGELSTMVAAVCQRCLEPFDLALHTNIKLLLTAAGATVEDSEDYEVWELDGETVGPADIVEEALIMAMPFSALHTSADDCSMWPDEGGENDPETTRPFADLKSLMAGDEEKN